MSRPPLAPAFEILTPLPKCSAEELAIHTYGVRNEGGIAFLRNNAERLNKDIARGMVLDLFHPTFWPGPLSILTMPSVEWKFERKLLGKREGDWMRKDLPERTKFTCVENHRSIYHGAVYTMPGVASEHDKKRGHSNTYKRTQTKPSLLTQTEAVPFAERGMRNAWVDAFYFCNVDDLIKDPNQKFDAAWLDYTGPLSQQRMTFIRKFYKESIGNTLIITSLRARWNKETSGTIERAGGLTKWITHSMAGEVLHDFEYQDGHSPMHQIALRKATL